MPIGSVNRLSSVMDRNGHRKLFQEPMNVRMAMEASAGRQSGSMMRMKIRQLPPPSIWTLSSRSFGMPSKKLFSTITATGEASAGIINP
ncbi:hypothetical protein D3C81_2100860 [compost metagenome]